MTFWQAIAIAALSHVITLFIGFGVSRLKVFKNMWKSVENAAAIINGDSFAELIGAKIPSRVRRLEVREKIHREGLIVLNNSALFSLPHHSPLRANHEKLKKDLLESFDKIVNGEPD